MVVGRTHIMPGVDKVGGKKMKNKKSLGQHWLKNRDILLDIADLSCADKITTAVEIGPGLGTLTSALFQFYDKVIAIEKDDQLAEKLPLSFPGKNLEIIHKDVLDVIPTELPTDYCLVGNIPYYITTPIIEKFLACTPCPKKITLLIQKEVADRVAATDGRRSFLSISVQAKALVELGPIVKKDLFTPPPKVDSRVLILTPRDKKLLDDKTLEFVRRGFDLPRKKLSANPVLRPLLPLANINPGLRPANLEIDDWRQLAMAKKS